jgi:putative PIN family toxin of toxin-antitoxin system
MRAVLDTNVLVSSLIKPGSVPDRIIEKWKAHIFEICLSEPLLDELMDVLNRPRIKRAISVSSEEMRKFLAVIREEGVFQRIETEVSETVLKDPDDDRILETAIAAEADVIVSGDRHLLDLGSYKGIPILTPRQFLAMLEEEL